MKAARSPRATASAACPMASLLQMLMGPWTTYILWVLQRDGPRRFGELKRAIPGISAKVLTERLRRLEGERVITRSYKATIPPQVTYALAERGHDLARVLDSLNEVATRWHADGPTGQVAPTKRGSPAPFPLPAGDRGARVRVSRAAVAVTPSPPNIARARPAAISGQPGVVGGRAPDWPRARGA